MSSRGFHSDRRGRRTLARIVRSCGSISIRCEGYVTTEVFRGFYILLMTTLQLRERSTLDSPLLFGGDREKIHRAFLYK